MNALQWQEKMSPRSDYRMHWYNFLLYVSASQLLMNLTSAAGRLACLKKPEQTILVTCFGYCRLHAYLWFELLLSQREDRGTKRWSSFVSDLALNPCLPSLQWFQERASLSPTKFSISCPHPAVTGVFYNLQMCLFPLRGRIYVIP